MKKYLTPVAVVLFAVACLLPNRYEQMGLGEAFQEGQRQAQFRGFWDVVLRGVLIIAAVIITISLPIAWYWKIPAFFGVFFVIAVIRTVVNSAAGW
jgi:presenilin-like A22 family membrane protease